MVAVNSPSSLVGTRVGNFRIDKRIGAGGMGEVYLLCHTRLPNTFAALKVIRANADARVVRERFIQEALVAAAVGSDRVARPIDIGRFDDGAPYMILEYARGRTLAQELDARGPLPVLVALRIVHAVADTMALVHARGIVHRDLKPSNLMLDGDRDTPTVKILDFGVARPPADLRIAETVEHAIVGSPGYMAPEAATGGKIDTPADVFSLGATLFRCLTGSTPFASASTSAVLLDAAPAIAATRPASLDAASVEVEALVERMFAKDAGSRPTMAEVRDAIATLADIPASQPSGHIIAVAVAPGEDAVASTLTIGSAGPAVDLPAIRAQLENLCEAKLPTARIRRRPNTVWLALPISIGIAVFGLAWFRRSEPTVSAPSRASFAAGQQQLTFAELAGIPDISPDGSRVAYVTKGAVVVLHLATGKQDVFYETQKVRLIRWSPEGRRLLYATDRGPKIVPLDGGTPRLYPLMAKWACHATWAPRGDQILWHCSGDPLWSMIDVASGSVRPVNIALPDPAWVADIDWSVATDRLALVIREGRNSVLWTCRSDGSELSFVRREDSPISTIRWSASGERVFYERAGDQSTDIVALGMTAPPSRQVIFTFPAATLDDEVAKFSIAPDESTLVYTRGASKENFVLQPLAAGAAARPLTSDTQMKAGFALSPTKRWVAFASGTARSKRLFRTPVEGGATEAISPPLGDLAWVAWSPDEKELVYSVSDASGMRIERFEIATGTVRKVRSKNVSEIGHVVWAPSREILYQRLGNRNYGIVDPVTDEELPLIADDSVGWVFFATPSEGGKVAVNWSRPTSGDGGLWVLSRDGGKGGVRIATEAGQFPIGWSDDGAWVYAVSYAETAQRIIALDATGTGRSRLLLSSRTEAMGPPVMLQETAVVQVAGTRETNLWLASAQPRSTVPTSTPIAPALPPRPIVLAAPTNLGFDGEVGQPAAPWSAHGATAIVTDACANRGRCLLLETDRDGYVAQAFDAAKYRGQRLRFRVSARFEGTASRLEAHTGLSWTTVRHHYVQITKAPWKIYELVVDVAPDAEYLELRVSTQGKGKLWIDDAAVDAAGLELP